MAGRRRDRAQVRRQLLRAGGEIVESLESRTLLAGVPTLISDWTDLTTASAKDDNAPAIAVHPTNSSRLVMVYTSGGGLAGQYGVIDAKGALTWTALTMPAAANDPVTGGAFPQATDPTVAFDRSGNFYVSFSEHSDDYTSGAIALQKFTWAAAGAPATSGQKKVLYQWAKADPAENGPEAAYNPIVVVDNNLSSFTDPDTGQKQEDLLVTNPLTPVYVAWNQDGKANDTVQIVASVDGGNTFSTQRQVNDDGSASAPWMTVSQGAMGGRVLGGQLNIVWNDFGGGAIKFDRVQDGGRGYASPRNVGGAVTDAKAGDADEDPHVPATTSFTTGVTINDPKFVVSDVNVVLSLEADSLADLKIVLKGPGTTGSVTLLDNRLDENGDERNGSGIAPPDDDNPSPYNLGVENGIDPGTVFDSEASVKISAAPVSARPYIGHFQPERDSLTVFNGKSINGTWTLEITDYRNNAAARLRYFYIQATSGLTTGTDVDAAPVGLTGAASAPYPLAPAVSPDRGIGPAPVIASDNTLGSFSPYQGRLYVAYTDQGAGPADDTDVFMVTSDDGGATWSAPLRVNDDSASDGFSGGDRPQFSPAVAVDQTTGTVVVTYYDARYDNARARVARFIATSIDGGATFGPQTYTNMPRNVLDAITGEFRSPGPIPENQSAGNNNRDQALGFGEHQGLAVAAGKVYSVWAGNQNGGLPSLDILTANVTIPAGARVISSDTGAVVTTKTVTIDGKAVEYNATFSPEGVRQLDGVLITFDRPIDPAKITVDSVRMMYRDVYTSGNAAGVDVPVTEVLPVDVAQFGPGLASGATMFLVRFEPQKGVGTYSYFVLPTAEDRIRTVSATNVVTKGNKADQNSNSKTGESPLTPDEATTAGVEPTIGDVYAMPRPTTETAYFKEGELDWFLPPYDPATYSLVIPGPHVVSATVPGANGGVILNDTVDSIDITFDRNMDPSTVTPEAIVRMMGPTGSITGPHRYTSLEPVRAIPNGPNAAPLSSTLRIPESYLIGDVNVQFDIAHANVGDLRLVLVAPDGTRVELVRNVGAGTANFTNTLLDDQALQPITAGASPFSLVTGYRPVTPLNALNMHDVRGDWKLEVYDTAGGAAGTLNAWSLIITPDIGSHSYAATGTPLAIPDGTATGSGAAVTWPLTITDSYRIGDLKVRLDIEHTYVNDLRVTLIAPDGTRHTLIQNVGDADANFTNTLLTDGSSVGIADGVGPYSLSAGYRPSTPLSDLDNKNIAGTWLLEVVDGAEEDTGTLKGWSLVALPADSSFKVIANPNGDDPDPANPRTYRFTFPEQTLSGSYSLVLGAGMQMSELTVGGRDGAAMDPNSNAGVDVLRDVSDVTETMTFPAGSLPQAIGSATVAGQVSRSTISITEPFVVNDVRLSLNITYPNDPDLEATLIGPDGTRVILFSGVGTTGSRQNFTGTIFDDAATTPIQNGGAPFFGRFNPQQPLSALGGVSSVGDWTLEIKSSVAGRTGTLTAWTLMLDRAVPKSGVGEAVIDQATVTFRIFTQDPANPQNHNVWTPIGPGSFNYDDVDANGDPVSATNFRAGRITALAADPSDPTGNTVYAGAASGGVWKTTNFLTTDPAGPTYVPVTDFGPTVAVHVGSIAIFPRNGDPNQSVVFVATGFGDIDPSTGESTPGAGILRSMDGGATWTVLDSLTNVDASGNPLPMSAAERDHRFVGLAANKLVVDPKPTLSGDIIIFAAFGGTGANNNAGVYRSIDSGRTWRLMRAGNATDVVLDPASGYFNAVSNPTGNLQYVYAGFQGEGVFQSTNRGQGWLQLAGGIGNPLIQDMTGVTPPRTTATPVPVDDPASTPNGNKGRVLLAKPYLTGSDIQDRLYQGWLYALVVSDDGHTSDDQAGLYLTKDFGQNWTRLTVTYDVGGADPRTNVDGRGNYSASLVVDPTNPNVIYVGGSGRDRAFSSIRIDVTWLSDPHAFYVTDDRDDGGALAGGGGDPVVLKGTPDSKAAYYNPVNHPTMNLLTDPLAPFNTSATIGVLNTTKFTNSGLGARASVFSVAGSDFDFDVHRMLAIPDLATGKTRLIVGTEFGVWTAVDNGNGTFDAQNAASMSPFNTRSGNLQIAEFLQGAVQPSDLAAQYAGALFYAQGNTDGMVIADPELLSNGNIGWYGGWGSGTGIATDQTGSGTTYRYAWPCCGGDITDFFQVRLPGQNAYIGRTFGLIQTTGGAEVPDAQWPYEAGFRFGVNPINGDQMVISSESGRIFGTTTQGRFWTVIGEPLQDANDNWIRLDGSNAQALAYGAPDPAGPGGDATNFLIYAGTVNGNIFVTFSGGGDQWDDISAGLDGSPVQMIVTNPLRGSHEAFAVTEQGVYHMADSSFRDPGTGQPAPWVDITGNLFSVRHNAFDDYQLSETQLRELTSLQADWRYLIPDDLSQPNGPTHPMLYVAGEGGVYRSVDKGATWTLYPDNTIDGVLNPGGYLPNARVSDLDLAIGDIDPTTGRALLKRTTTNLAGETVESTGFNILLATTYGRGSYMIRLAPVMVPGSVRMLDQSDNGVSSTDRITSITTPIFSGVSQQSGFGNTVRVTLLDMTDAANPVIIGGYDPADPTTDVAANWTDERGRFTVQVRPNMLTTDGVKVIGVRASDASGVTGATTPVTFTLDLTLPAAPSVPDLAAASDSGTSNTDNITNVKSPTFTGTAEPNAVVNLYGNAVLLGTAKADWAGLWSIKLSAALADGSYSITAEQIDVLNRTGPRSAPLTLVVDTTAPTGTSGAPELTAASDSGSLSNDRITSVTRPTFTGSAPAGSLVQLMADRTILGFGTADAGGRYSITVASSMADGTYTIKSLQIDLAGNAGPASSGVAVTIDTTPPAAPAMVDLAAASDSGISNSDNITNIDKPTFTGAVLNNAPIFLYSDGVLIGTGVASPAGAYSITLSAALAEGVHQITAVQADAAGNLSAASAPLALTIDLTKPATPPSMPDLSSGSDSGTADNDDTTNVTVPTFIGTAIPSSPVRLYANDVLVGSGTADEFGNYSITVNRPFAADGAYSLVAEQLDLAGNVSDRSEFLAVTIDTRPPGQLASAPDLAAMSDSGLSDTDNVTKVVRPTFVGVAEPGAVVRLSVNGVFAAAGAADAAGAYVIELPADLPGGSYSIVAQQVDEAGNISVASAALVLTIDTTVAIPGAPDLTAASDSGLYSNDNLTNVTTPTFTGTVEANALVEILANAVVVGSGNADAQGGYSVAVSSALAAGSYNITVRQTDPAGNTSDASAPLLVTVDTQGPDTVVSAPDLIAAADTGLADNDNITSVTTPTFTGVADRNAPVQLFANGNLVASGMSDGLGIYTIAVAPALTPGVYSMTARTIDIAGNGGPMSDALSLTIDTSAPGAPGAPDLVDGSDTGVSATDNITANSRPTFSGSADPDSLVQIYSGTTLLGGAVSDGQGLYTVTVDAAMADGTYNITARQIDPAGNTSPRSAGLSIVIDTTSPTGKPNIPDLSDGSDTGSYTDDNLTRTQRPTFVGTASPNATVEIFADGTRIGQGQADGTGAYSVTSETDLAEGEHAITSRELDTAGNASPVSDPVLITIDLTGPDTSPSVPDLVDASDTGVSNTDNLTASTRPTFAGMAEPGARIQILANGAVVGSSIATDEGAYAVTLSQPLADGVYVITAEQVDVAGNPGPASESLTIAVDATAIAPTTPDILFLEDSGNSSTDNITNFNVLLFTGTAEPGATVDLMVGDAILGTGVADPAGMYAIGILPEAPLADGAYAIAARQTDPAGNISALSEPLNLVVDTVAQAPSSPDLADASDSGVSNNDNITLVDSPTFAGTAEPYAVVIVYANEFPLGAGEADASGAYSVQMPALPEGLWSIWAVQYDLAGNESVASESLMVTVDKTPPAEAPSAPDLTDASDSGASSSDNLTRVAAPSFSGTAAANAPVELYADDVLVGEAIADDQGRYVVTVSSPLADGSYAFRALQRDTAGNASTLSAELGVTIDTTSSGTTNTPDLADESDTGVSATDNLTNDNTPTFSGTASPMATVQIFANGQPVGQAVADDQGAYSVTAGAPLPDGAYDITAWELDAAGNVGDMSVPLAIRIDTVAPTGASRAIGTSEGQAFSGVVASFTDPQPAGSATIDWGDGNTTAGTISAGAAGVSNVSGSHTYGSPGSYTIHVMVADAAGNIATINSTANVVNPAVMPVSGLGLVVNAVENQMSSPQVVAKFTDPGGPEPVEEYSALINWGDGTAPTAGVVELDPQGAGYVVTGQHVYGDPGNYSVTTVISHVSGGITALDAVATATATVVNPAMDATGGFTFNAVEGVAAAAQTVAVFTDPGGAEAISTYSATISWGDGQVSQGVIAYDSGTGLFTVSGAHLYALEGAYTISVQIRHTGATNALDAVVTSLGAVANPPLTARGDYIVLAVEGTASAEQAVATFTDPGAPQGPGAYSAEINWGDGTPASAGVIVYNGATEFVVRGSHLFVNNGEYEVTVTIRHPNAPDATVKAMARVGDAPIDVTARTLTIGEGHFNGVVATLMDSNPLSPRTDFAASINWGDGTTSDGEIIADPAGAGRFTVVGDHVYANGPSSYTISIRVDDQGGPTDTATGTVTVQNTAPAPILPSSTVLFIGQRATFTIAASDASAADADAGFTYRVNWGDGSPVQTIRATRGNADGVNVSHAYGSAAVYSVQVTVTDRDGSAGQNAFTATVVQPPRLAGVQINGGSKNRSRINTIGFRIVSPDVAIESLSVSNLKLLCNGNSPVSLSRARLSYDAATGAALLDLTSVKMPDGNYQLQIRPAEGVVLAYKFFKLAGDADANGKVNGRDQTFVQSRLGTSRGEPDFNPSADLYTDGVINTADVRVVTKNLGRVLARVTKPVAMIPGRQPVLPGVDFGRNQIGKATPVDVVIRNRSVGQALYIRSIGVKGAGFGAAYLSGLWDQAPSGVVVPAGKSMRIRVMVKSTQPGQLTGQLTFAYSFNNVKFGRATIPLSAVVRR